MILGKKLLVVLPAYNAEKTIEKTLREIPTDIVDDIVVVDDFSSDKTVQKVMNYGIKHIIRHKNKGYGANQKTCFKAALELNADIIIVLHPDYQYSPKLIYSMAYLIANGVYPVVFGSRILGKGALKGGMPLYKYFFNRVLTLIQNLLMNQKLSEYHTGYRAYSSEVLNKIRFEENSNGFLFDNEIIAQTFSAGYEIAEITCPTRYEKESSTIGFWSSVKYGIGCILTSLRYTLNKFQFIRSNKYESK